jgi:predicted  nucleic acid-binding Zn-ribbon protein
MSLHQLGVLVHPLCNNIARSLDMLMVRRMKLSKNQVKLETVLLRLFRQLLQLEYRFQRELTRIRSKNVRRTKYEIQKLEGKLKEAIISVAPTVVSPVERFA